MQYRKHLPPLAPLVAFEAAARLGSFSQAADELNVTAAAVSQQIKSLEGQLGCPLFHRAHKSVQLLPKGKEYLASVAMALNHLSQATADLQGHAASDRLVVAVDTSIAALWLVPRLAELHRLYPDVSVKLQVTDVQADLLSAEADFALIHGRGTWTGVWAEQLFPEEVFPVCSPDFLASSERTLTNGVWVGSDLIELEYEDWNWINWTIWCTRMELPIPEASRRLRINSYPLVVDAAKQGLGVALGWRHLVDGDLASGALVRPTAQSLKTEDGYFLIMPRGGPQSKTPPQSVTAFKDWVMSLRGCDVR